MAAVHAAAADLLDGVRIGAVASRDPEHAAVLAARAGARPCTYEQLPAGCPAVVVATPPALHAAHALAAAGAGAAVLVEKPLCTTLAEADRLVAAAAAGAPIAYAENLVHAPVVGRALEHAAQLHGIDVLEVRAIQPRPTWGDFLTEGWGGGALFDLGPHPLALALLLAAPATPVEVSATLGGADDHPVDEHAEVGLRFDSGALARIVVSWRGAGDPVWDAQASAPDGVVRFELLPRPLLERNGVEVRLPPLPADQPAPLVALGYVDQLRSFAADVAGGRPPTVGAAFGRSVLDVVCGAYASAAEDGAWVPLPFTGSRTRTPHQLWRR